MSKHREQAPYPQGGEIKQNSADEPPLKPDPKKEASWQEGDKGQGAQGLSHGYGGSEGDGTGSSGPEDHPEPIATDDALGG